MARLDAELVARGIARSRERAKEMISSGAVLINGITAKKASENVSAEDEITSAEQELYVGRGALKLEKAVDVFGLELSGMRCLDIGASTGGFTELMLEKGAAEVFSVDVGHGQLAESLRRDCRVTNMEGTDIRNVTAENIGGKVDFISVDVSFISLSKILPKIYELLKSDGYAAVLIKPQFEAGKKNVGKKGVVKDRKVHLNVLEELDDLIRITGFAPLDYTYSPIKGGNGNIEYLVKLKKSAEDPPPRYNFAELVNEVFGKL